MRPTINIYPNKTLFEKAKDIPLNEINSATFSQIGSSMLEILKKKGGIGLSANQVGLNLNMCVVSITPNNPLILLNPRIARFSKDMVASKEGCLSLPGATVTVSRHKNITIIYEDVRGETINLDATGLESCCLQHEIDHLKGILMVNRVGEYHKSKALKAVYKFKRIKR